MFAFFPFIFLCAEAELTFAEGDVIEVLQKNGDWWYGRMNGIEVRFFVPLLGNPS